MNLASVGFTPSNGVIHDFWAIRLTDRKGCEKQPCGEWEYSPMMAVLTGF